MPKKLEYHGLTAGQKQPPEYQVWAQIKQRCYNPRHKKYHLWGGRGIRMDPLWKKSFTTFLKAVGPRPKKGKWNLDLINKKKGYYPGNVRWTTPQEQSYNKRNNHLIEFNGVKKPIAQVAAENGMSKRRLRERIVASGLSPEEAVARPIEGGTRFFVWRNVQHNLATWSSLLNIPYMTLHNRLFKMGWSTEEAFTTPSDPDE